MKIIVSHDIDYITFWEHKKNLVIPKYFVRIIIEYLNKYVTFGEFKIRLKNFLFNKFQSTKEQMKYDEKNKIPSTFFVAVSRGRDNLCYSYHTAKKWISLIINEGFDVGVHGIAFDNLSDLNNEYRLFRRILKKKSFGIRIHYLKTSSNTLDLLHETGYIYDSSIYELKPPFKNKLLWEFPISVMDVDIFNNGNRWQSRTLEQAKEHTIKIIEEALDIDLPFFTILLHDQNFNDGYLSYKYWYIWLMEYFKDNCYEFVNFRQAIQILEKK